MATVSFSPVIYKHRQRPDKSYQVQIRVTYKRKSRYMSTNLSAYYYDLTSAGTLKQGNLMIKSLQFIERQRTVLGQLAPGVLEYMDVDDVVDYLRAHLYEQHFHLDFFEFADKYVQRFSDSTRRAYTRALNALERFIGQRHIDINELTRPMLIEFMTFIDDEPKMYWSKVEGALVPSPRGKRKVPGAASTQIICKLQHIFYAAKDKYNDDESENLLIPRDPFKTIKKRYPDNIGQKNLGVEVMQHIIYATDLPPQQRIALDVFMLSFCMMGANMADLWAAKRPRGKVWAYHRQKTAGRRSDGAEMRVFIPVEAQPFIDRLQGSGSSDYWLQVLRDFAKDKDRATARVNRYLKQWAADNMVEPFTLYAARKSWATSARRAGVEKATIDECLAHRGSLQMADIYIEKDWQIINSANTTTLAQFSWPEKSGKLSAATRFA